MFKFFTSDIRRNLTKVLCLTAGLAIGFLLVAKIYFEQTYDSFFPDSHRLYYVYESCEVLDEYKEYAQTPGAIAPGLKQYVPLVENATRSTGLTGTVKIRLEDGRLLDVEAIQLADSCFFDVFETPVLSGNPHDALSIQQSCMIPRSLADKIGGDVIGMSVTSPSISDDYTITINGVYEDFPLNSSIGNYMYLSLCTLDQFSPKSRTNWLGNDRYKSYVKLVEGASPEQLQPYIDRMLADNVDAESLGISHFNIGVKPLSSKYLANSGVSNMIWVLSLLAVVMLMSAGLNFLLIVIGQMGKRTKEMAVRKCYGTSNTRIFARIIGETLFFLTLSLGLAIFLVFCFSDLCRDLLGYTPSQLLTTGHVWMVELGVCLLLLVITGAIPAWMYCRTPVANAFRTNIKSRRAWKLILLSVQFFASGLLVCLLSLVGRQYYALSNAPMGFEYENLGHVALWGIPQEQRSTLVSEISRLGCVEGVSSADHNFIEKCSGNNVWLGNEWDRTVNVADMYSANRNIFDILGIKLVQGDIFREKADTTCHQVIVEERFSEVILKITGIEDHDLVDKTFNITEHANPSIDGTSEFTICGVMANTRRGGFETDQADTRAGVMFYSPKIQLNLFVRFHQLSPENLHAVQAVIDNICPGKELYITPMKTYIEGLTAPVRHFGTSVIIAGLSILLITLIGLVGYTTDEVQRRSREIAIRKVTGTSAGEIMRLFCLDIFKVALPSLLLGAGAAVIIGQRWLSQFTERVTLSPLVLILCIATLLLLLLAIVALNSHTVARSNPVNHLRTE